jgi:adenylyltransferase/sulfurtransferase
LPDVGGIGQCRLLAATVAVERADGAGAVALLYLAAAGVGTLIVADVEAVAGADGILYEVDDVGRPRREAARDRLAALNPDVAVRFDGMAAHRLAPPPAPDAARALALGAEAAARVVKEIVR